MNTDSIPFKIYSKILQKIPAPKLLINTAEPKSDPEDHRGLESGIYGEWANLSSDNASAGLDSQGSLRGDFLRQPSITQTIHPNQRSVGVRIGCYLARTAFGSHLLATASESLFGQPYLVQPSFPCFSSSGLQSLSYIHLVYESWGINLVDSEKAIHFVDYGGGYGNMARFLVHLNDNIRVSILDLPSMLRLQKLYHLNTISSGNALGRIEYRKSEFKNYQELTSQSPNSHLHFNATFSLNESPLEARNCIADTLLGAADTFFIAYSPEFYGINNETWADSLKARLCEDYFLLSGVLPGYKTSKYLTGKRKSML